MLRYFIVSHRELTPSSATFLWRCYKQAIDAGIIQTDEDVALVSVDAMRKAFTALEEIEQMARLCSHELCSLSESVNEEMFGAQVLQALDVEVPTREKKI